MKTFILILIMFFSGAPLFSQNCGATQCASWGMSNHQYKRKLDKFDAIFYGEIISQSEPENFSRRLKVKVLRVWKGIEAREVEVNFKYYDNDCLKIGESGKRIFYVYSIKDSPMFQTGWCDKYAANDAKTEHLLGKGKTIEESPSPMPPSDSNENADVFWSGLWQKIVSLIT